MKLIKDIIIVSGITMILEALFDTDLRDIRKSRVLMTQVLMMVIIVGKKVFVYQRLYGNIVNGIMSTIICIVKYGNNKWVLSNYINKYINLFLLHSWFDLCIIVFLLSDLK